MDFPFAWFQAEANVQIQTSSTSTTITVENPNETFNMSVYAYNGGNPYKPSAVSSATWSDFTSKSTIDTSVFWPGYSVTYCLVSTPCENSHSLTIGAMASSGYISSSPDLRYIYENSSTTTTSIDIRWAMKIYGTGMVGTSASGGGLNNANITSFLQSRADSNTPAVTKYSRARGDSSDTISTLAEATPTNSNPYLYLFFTVHFSNHSSTWYQYVNDNGERQRSTPAFTGTSYWLPYSSGSTLGFGSTAYQGLRFKIDQLVVA